MKKKYTLYFIAVLIIVTLVLLLQKTVSDFQNNRKTQKKGMKPNIILISLDILRADRLHCYGYPRKTSPEIDSFAADGVLFENVLCQYPTTPQSHSSLLTSRYYSTLSRNMARTPSFPVMAEILGKAGYYTAGFVDGGFMKRQFGYGFSRGFDFYYDEGPSVEPGKKIEWYGIENINQQVFAWLEDHRTEPFFLLFHCYDVHCPYTPPEPYFSMYSAWYSGDLDVKGKCGFHFNELSLNDDDFKFLSDLYDGGVRYTDHELGKFFRKLKALELYKDALIILCSDHGESLGEKGFVGHNRLYKHQLQVPLIIKLPGSKNSVCRTPVQLLDILPTLIDCLGLSLPPGLEGVSLLPLIQGEEDARSREKIRICERDHYRWIEKGAQWGLLYDLRKKEASLFNLLEDPERKENIIQEHMDVAEDLFQLFSRSNSYRFGQHRLRGGVDDIKSKTVMDRKTREQLTLLGYLD